MKTNNNTVTKIVTALIIAAVLGVFGFARGLDRRIDKHDIELAKIGKDIEYIREGIDKLLDNK